MDRILAHRLLQCSKTLLCKGRWFVNLLLACHELQRNRCKSNGGADRDRTGDLLNAIQALSQLSYGPTYNLHDAKKILESQTTGQD